MTQQQMKQTTAPVRPLELTTVRLPADSRLRGIGRALAAYLYLVPAVALVGGLLLYSVFFTFGISFTDWTLLSDPNFVGFAKYLNILSDPTFQQSFTNTLLWTVGSLVLPVSGGLIVAVILERLPGQRVWKVMIYLPTVLAATVTGVVWGYIYSTNGVLNQILSAIGLDFLTQPWLVDAPVNTISMIITSTWRALGPSMVLFLIGLQTIPTELIEAAKLDGAAGWSLFYRVKLPLLRPITSIVVTMSVIGSFTTFDLVWVMTQGGPYRSSETLAVTMYRQAFVLWDLGYAAALAVILSTIVLVFSIFYLRSTFRREV